MKKPFLFAAFFVLFAMPVVTQQSMLPPPPSPAPDYSPKIWKEYSFADDNVKFKFPVAPKVEETTSEGKYPTHTYNRHSFMDFQLMVVEHSVDVEAISKKTDLLNKMREGALEGAKDYAPRVIKESDIDVDGHAGKFLQLETNDGLVIRFKFFIANSKTYFLTASVKKGSRHGFNWENDFEIPAMGFLDSIHLINK